MYVTFQRDRKSHHGPTSSRATRHDSIFFWLQRISPDEHNLSSMAVRYRTSHNAFHRTEKHRPSGLLKHLRPPESPSVCSEPELQCHPSSLQRPSVRQIRNSSGQTANNQALTEAVHALFSLLHSWDEDAADDEIVSHSPPAAAGHISLALDAYSPTDVDHRGHLTVEADRLAAQLAGGRPDLFEHRYERSFLRVSDCERLSTVSRIGGFYVEELCHRRRILGRSLAGIAAKLPNLETIVWAVNDDGRRDALVRQEHRYGKHICNCLFTRF